MQLFFDLDGTLTDSRPGILACMRHALRAIGREPPSDAVLSRLIGPPTKDAFRELLGTDDAPLVERAIALYRERFSTVGMFENSVYPGIEEALAALGRRGVPMWVVTSKPQVYAESIVEHFGLRPAFVRVYGSELSGERGKKGELIAHVLRVEALTPDANLDGGEPWMIGDRLHDIVGAKENGIRAAGVLWGYGSHEELVDAGAEVVFANPGELARFFESADLR